MSRPAAILFDFDGVLLESEHAGIAHLADWLTARGHPIAPAQVTARFTGLAGSDFIAAIEAWTGERLPDDFHVERRAEHDRAIRDGLDPVAGAVAFVQALPPDLPRAIVSSSSTAWIAAHLAHLGLAGAFGGHLYSGREHVARGKPAPDLYLYGADRLGVAIAEAVILEDSVVGATGALAAGARVIGLCAGLHCDPGHADRLRGVGVAAIAHDFAEVARLIGW